MKNYGFILFAVFGITFSSLTCTSSDNSVLPRSTAPLIVNFPGSTIPKLVDTTMPIVVIYVDFQNGRMPDGSLPTADADTANFSGDSINAVGSMGWVRTKPEDPHSPLRKKIRKYRYEDYWDMLFSDSSYCDDSIRGTHPSPDYNSHGTAVYGSMRDYYREVSYGKFTVRPESTWPGPQDMYHTGIVNRTDSAGGNHYIHWIRLNGNKEYYKNDQVSIIGPALQRLDSLHHLPVTDPEYVAFNRALFKGKYAVIGAGSNIGGATFIGNNAYAVSEKAYYIPNNLPLNQLDGIMQNIHEFAHTLGLEHIELGSFDPMSWGGEVAAAQHCPPHFNPLTKYLFGWLKPDEILMIDSTAKNILLRSSHLPPAPGAYTAVFIDVNHPQGGLSKPSPHAREYFIVEYRTRVGFNRFSGGSDLPTGSDFRGGALIWHYSSTGNFSYKLTDQISRYLSLEIPGYNENYSHGMDQLPEDYFFPGKIFGPADAYPNSNSITGSKTGIIVENFEFINGNLKFDVKFSQ